MATVTGANPGCAVVGFYNRPCHSSHAELTPAHVHTAVTLINAIVAYVALYRLTDCGRFYPCHKCAAVDLQVKDARDCFVPGRQAYIEAERIVSGESQGCSYHTVLSNLTQCSVSYTLKHQGLT